LAGVAEGGQSSAKGDAMEETFKALQQTLVERFSSPLLSSFVIAWLGWNYKFVMIVMSSNTVTTTLDLIHRVSFPDWQAIALHGIAYPLGSALAYIFLYPYPARWVYKFVLHQQRASNLLRSTIEEETPLTLEESSRLREEYKKRNLDLQDELQRSEADGERYRQFAAQLEGRESNLQKDNKALSENADSAAQRLADSERKLSVLQGRFDELQAATDDLGQTAQERAELRSVGQQFNAIEQRILEVLSQNAPGQLVTSKAIAQAQDLSSDTAAGYMDALAGRNMLSVSRLTVGGPHFEISRDGSEEVKAWLSRKPSRLA
jgi:hypothetical protein